MTLTQIKVMFEWVAWRWVASILLPKGLLEAPRALDLMGVVCEPGKEGNGTKFIVLGGPGTGLQFYLLANDTLTESSLGALEVSYSCSYGAACKYPEPALNTQVVSKLPISF